MITVIKNKEDEEISFTTQQYEVGLYLIINNNPAKQYSLNVHDEKEWHKSLRKGILEKGEEIILEKRCASL